jgi:hypothetical protein
MRNVIFLLSTFILSSSFLLMVYCKNYTLNYALTFFPRLICTQWLIADQGNIHYGVANQIQRYVNFSDSFSATGNHKINHVIFH